MLDSQNVMPPLYFYNHIFEKIFIQPSKFFLTFFENKSICIFNEQTFQSNVFLKTQSILSAIDIKIQQYRQLGSLIT
jgi:hypothetical protein